MNYFCLAVKTGSEEKIVKASQKALDGQKYGFAGRLLIFKKLMRLKKGKVYKDLFFPGYIFLETECGDPKKLSSFKSENGVYGFLPKADSPKPLYGTDLNVVQSLINFGNTMGFLRAKFNKDDRIVITNPLFNNLHGKIVSVTRRNHRVKVLVDLFGAEKVFDLTYYDIEKEDWTSEENSMRDE